MCSERIKKNELRVFMNDVWTICCFRFKYAFLCLASLCSASCATSARLLSASPRGHVMSATENIVVCLFLYVLTLFLEMWSFTHICDIWITAKKMSWSQNASHRVFHKSKFPFLKMSSKLREAGLSSGFQIDLLFFSRKRWSPKNQRFRGHERRWSYTL